MQHRNVLRVLGNGLGELSAVWGDHDAQKTAPIVRTNGNFLCSGPGNKEPLCANAALGFFSVPSDFHIRVTAKQL